MSEEQCNRCGNMAHFVDGGNPKVSASLLSELLSCAEHHEDRASEPILSLEGLKECAHKKDLEKCLPVWKAKSKAKHLKWAKLLRELVVS